MVGARSGLDGDGDHKLDGFGEHRFFSENQTPYSPTRGSHLAGDFDIRPSDIDIRQRRNGENRISSAFFLCNTMLIDIR